MKSNYKALKVQLHRHSCLPTAAGESAAHCLVEVEIGIMLL